MLIGGYCWGSIGDSLGRRKTLIIAMIVNTIFGTTSSLAQTKTPFFILRFLSGLGVGGSIPLVWSYFAEFQCKSRRGRMLSALATFWMIGNISVAGLAWAVIPYEIGTNNGEFLFNSWRIFVAICGIPAFLVTLALCFMPESPKFLLSKGREQDALKVFALIYKQNTGNAHFPIEHIRTERRVIMNQRDSGIGQVQQILNNTLVLFEKPLMWVTVMMLYINFSIQFG